MLRLAFQSLRSRWSRALTAIIGIGLAISIAYVMSGVTEAFQAETTTTLRTLGDHFLVPEDSSGLINTLTDASVVPEGTHPVVFGRDSLESRDLDLNVFGVDPGTVAVARGRSLEEPGEVVLDVSAELAIGATLTLVGTELEVVGLTDGARMYAGGPVAFVHVQDARDIFYSGRPVAQFFASEEAVEAPAGLVELPFADAKDDIDRAVRGAIRSLALTTTLLWIMVAGVVFVLNRLTLLDRRSELATLKCLGAGGWVIGSSLVMESVLVGALGAVVGCLGGIALAPLFPLAVESSSATATQIVLLAVAVSLLAALLGTLSLRSVSPGDAFRGEV